MKQLFYTIINLHECVFLITACLFTSVANFDMKININDLFENNIRMSRFDALYFWFLKRITHHLRTI